jgi:hypothetical protein
VVGRGCYSAWSWVRFFCPFITFSICLFPIFSTICLFPIFSIISTQSSLLTNPCFKMDTFTGNLLVHIITHSFRFMLFIAFHSNMYIAVRVKKVYRILTPNISNIAHNKLAAIASFCSPLRSLYNDRSLAQIRSQITEHDAISQNMSKLSVSKF